MQDNVMNQEPNLNHQNNSLDFTSALKSFLGYLVGTEKATHTVKNYQSDLMTFQEFLKTLNSPTINQLTREDLLQYGEYLKVQGLGNNSRRRKLLTVRKLMRFLNQRNKLDIDIGAKLPAPYKIERVPHTLEWTGLRDALVGLPHDTELMARNRALLWTLCETGCQVSEVCDLRYLDVALLETGDEIRGAEVSFTGKNARTVPISHPLYEALCALRVLARQDEDSYIFFGFNKFGSLGAPISSRGVELVVRAYKTRLQIDTLVPRTFRHSVVKHWYASGVDRDEIQRRLGLRTSYSFRVYEPIFNTLDETSQQSDLV